MQQHGMVGTNGFPVFIIPGRHLIVTHRLACDHAKLTLFTHHLTNQREEKLDERDVSRAADKAAGLRDVVAQMFLTLDNHGNREILFMGGEQVEKAMQQAWHQRCLGNSLGRRCKPTRGTCKQA